MAFPTSFARLQVLGDFFYVDQLEQWSFSLNFWASGLENAAGPGQNTGIAAALTSWWDDYMNPATGASMGDQTRLLGFKWNQLDSTGHYETPTTPNTYTFETPLVGIEMDPPRYPPQIAVVVSLRTGLVGKSYNGRVYLPPLNWALGDGFTVDASGMATGMASLIGDLNAVIEPATGMECCVVSSKGFATKVVSCRVGNRLDTQRRRRRSLVETYSVSASV